MVQVTGSDSPHTSTETDAESWTSLPVVLGLGMSSAASAHEVRELIRQVLEDARPSLEAHGHSSTLNGEGVDMTALTRVATRQQFVHDGRAQVGPPIVAVDDDVLLEQYPVPSEVRSDRFAARVAEGCALTSAGPGATLLVP